MFPLLLRKIHEWGMGVRDNFDDIPQQKYWQRELRFAYVARWKPSSTDWVAKKLGSFYAADYEYQSDSGQVLPRIFPGIPQSWPHTEWLFSGGPLLY